MANAIEIMRLCEIFVDIANHSCFEKTREIIINSVEIHIFILLYGFVHIWLSTFGGNNLKGE